MRYFLVYDGLDRHPKRRGFIPDVGAFEVGQSRELTDDIVTSAMYPDAETLAVFLADPEVGLWRDRYHVIAVADDAPPTAGATAPGAPPEVPPDPTPADPSVPDSGEPA